MNLAVIAAIGAALLASIDNVNASASSAYNNYKFITSAPIMHNHTFQIAAKELELGEKFTMKASMRKSSNATQEKDGVTGCQRMEKSSLRNMDKEYGI